LVIPWEFIWPLFHLTWTNLRRGTQCNVKHCSWH